MKYCIKCEVNSDDKYCHICGEQQECVETKVEQIETINDIGMIFNLIPAGEFNMGSNGWNDSKPCHNVFVEKPFHIGKYPVTQWEWEVLMGSNPSHFSGEQHPVEMVSWRDCQEFIDRLNIFEGTNKYRFPSEVEWEFACRAGDPKDYYFKNDIDQLGRYAWFQENSDDRTHNIGEKRPNKWGLHDMLGNVWEWCEDNWHENYCRAPRNGRAWLISESYYHVDRGGSWGSTPEKCISACRDWNLPGDHTPYIGFRLAYSM